MSSKPNFLIRFWQEVQRRKVLKVLTMYAGSAFVLIQVVDILTNRLFLPPWIPTLTIIIISVGFPITAVLAWIFDLTPEGIKKTESFEEIEAKAVPIPHGRRRLKASDAAIFVLAIAVIILAWPKIFKPDSVERLRSSGKKLSIAIMPVQNLTNDTTLNVWQKGIQQRLSSYLGNTDELQIRSIDNVRNLLQDQGVAQYASFSPYLAAKVSDKLNADIFLYGTIQKAGQRISLDAQLTDTKTGEIIKSFEFSGPFKDEIIFDLTDSLRKKVSDFLILSKLIKENAYLQHLSYVPKSPDVIKYYLLGSQAGDFQTARSWYLKSLGLDSSFTDAAFAIMQSYSWEGNHEENLRWILKLYGKRDQMALGNALYTSWAYAYNFGSAGEQIKYLEQMLELDDQDPGGLYLLGSTYSNSSGQYDKAIPLLTKSVEIQKRWDKKYMKDNWALHQLALAHFKEGSIKKMKTLCREAEKYDPDDDFIARLQAVQALTVNDTFNAGRYTEKLINIVKKNSGSETDIALTRANIYVQAGMIDKAVEYIRKVLSLKPENPDLLVMISGLLFSINRDLDEIPDLMDRAMKSAPNKLEYCKYLDTKGWALYKMGRTKEAVEIIKKAWDETPFKLYSIRSHFEEVEKAAREKGLV